MTRQKDPAPSRQPEKKSGSVVRGEAHKTGSTPKVGQSSSNRELIRQIAQENDQLLKDLADL